MPTIQTSAGPLAYVDSGGPGPTLLFAHGLAMTHTKWDAVVPLLPGYRCVRPTLPMGGHRHAMRREADLGHRGQARLLLELCRQLDLRDVTLVLNDWGGGQFAVLEPGGERISRLVLVACEAFDNFPPPSARPLAAALAVPGVAWLVMQALRVRAVRHAPMAYGGLSLRRLPDDVMDEWFAPARRDAAIRRDFVAFARSAPDRATLLEWSAALAGFAGSVLVVWAALDRLMPAEHGPRLAALYPGGRLAVVPESATLVPFDQPQRLAELMRGFLIETQAPSQRVNDVNWLGHTDREPGYPRRLGNLRVRRPLGCRLDAEHQPSCRQCRQSRQSRQSRQADAGLSTMDHALGSEGDAGEVRPRRKGSPMRRAGAAGLILSVVLCLPLSGCWQEHMCADGEYPVLWPDNKPAMCVKDGEPPPPGTKPYPPGQTPSLYPPEKGPNATAPR